MFLGERDMATRGSCLTDVYDCHNSTNDHHYSYHDDYYDENASLRVPSSPETPPDDFPFATNALVASMGTNRREYSSAGNVSAWLEIWDYAGGSSFRAFVSEDGTTRNLFVFFDAGVLERDLKQA